MIGREEVACRLQSRGDVVEDGDGDDAFGVFVGAGVAVGSGHVEEERAEGHGAGDEEEGGR